MPNLTMACVCPPQTSMSVQGRVRDRGASARRKAGRRVGVAVLVDELHDGSAPSQLGELAHLPCRYSNTCAASASSTVEMAKPTWTST